MGKESLDSCPRLKLTEINPFTPRHRDIINGILDGKNYQEIASLLGISYKTVKSLVYHPWGVFGRVEDITGEWPGSCERLIAILWGDVLILKSDGDGTEKSITR